MIGLYTLRKSQVVDLRWLLSACDNAPSTDFAPLTTTNSSAQTVLFPRNVRMCSSKKCVDTSLFVWLTCRYLSSGWRDFCRGSRTMFERRSKPARASSTRWRWRIAAFIIFASAASAVMGTAKPERNGLMLDVSWPHDKLVIAIREIVAQGDIHGTWQYHGEDRLAGAASGPVSDPFGPLPQGAQAFYQVKRGVISPAHFLGSNDIGTVTVRYALLRLDETKTRLTIDAIFVEDGHRTRHLSDGSVEASEFGEIGSRFTPPDSKPKVVSSEEKLRQVGMALTHATQADGDNQLLELWQSIGEQQSALIADQRQIQELSTRLEQSQRQAQLRVKTLTARLRAEPFSSATVLEAVPQHESVTVLRRTPFWYEVKTASETRGWMHCLSLEPMQ